MLFRPQGMYPARQVLGGDILAAGEALSALAADANSTITGAMMAAGILNRTGMTAGRIDTTDTAENVLLALSGNDVDRNALVGLSFRFIYRQSAAFATTWAHGRGWVAGTGTLDVTASRIREYVCRILCAQKEVAVANATTHNGTKAIELITPQNAGTVVPGMLLTGAGITAGTKVVGVTYGDSTNRINGDKICSITTDTNSTADASGVALTFSPVIEINSVGERTL